MPATSLKTRLKAWWEGYDLPETVATRRSSGAASGARATRQCRFSPEVEAMHLIFGQGRTLPLPLNPISDLPEPLDCPSGMAALFAGAETGGPAIELASSHEIQVTALEPDRVNVGVGEELSRQVEFDGSFRIGPVDLENVELSQNRFHLLVCRLLLHTIPERELLYRKFERAMRPMGTQLLTQFTVAEGADREKVAARMTSSIEPVPPLLMTAKEEKAVLVENGMRPQMVEDLTDRVRDDVVKIFGNWQRMVEEIARFEAQPRMLQTLLAQVEHWQPRITMMEQDDLKVTRFQSQKRRNELL